MRLFQTLSGPTAFVLFLGTASIFCGCSSSRNTGNGPAMTAATSNILESNPGSSEKEATPETTIGGAAGDIIDLYMDKQAEEIRNKVTEARVERFSKGIRIIFDTEVLFSTDSATINPESSSQIEQLALILAKYADTDIFIEVHADTITAEPSNPGLSERRADSIASILWLYRVSQRRFSSVGYHEPRPNATSETETWSLLNNRTVMLIHANNELKRLAKAGELRL